MSEKKEYETQHDQFADGELPGVFVFLLSTYQEYENANRERRIEILQHARYFLDLNLHSVVFGQILGTKKEREEKARKKDISKVWGI